MHNRIELSKDVGVSFGWVRVMTKSELDDRETERPDVGGYRVSRHCARLLALDTLRGHIGLTANVGLC